MTLVDEVQIRTLIASFPGVDELEHLFLHNNKKKLGGITNVKS